MKNKIYLSSFILLIVISTSCKKDPKETCSGYGSSWSVLPSTNPSSGNFGGERDITSSVNSFKTNLSNQGVTDGNIKTLIVDKVTIRLPSGFILTDFSSLDIMINGQKVATLPNGATGTTQDFTLTAETNVKPLFFRSAQAGVVSSHTLSFLATTRKTVASNISIGIDVHFQTCY